MSETPASDGGTVRGGAGQTGAPPRSHVPDDNLGAYVVGDCSHVAALAIACHLTLCGRCRARCRLLEDLGGLALEGGAAALPEDPLGGLWAATLAHLDDVNVGPGGGGEAGGDAAVPVPAFLAGCGLPRPLLGAVAARGPATGWGFLAPGVRFVNLTPGQRSTARLVNLRPGLEIPLHDHEGTEYTVIFTGALEDTGTRFGRGDLLYRVPGQRHVQRVTPDAPCIALQVNEGPLKPLTWKGRLLSLLVQLLAVAQRSKHVWPFSRTASASPRFFSSASSRNQASGSSMGSYPSSNEP